MLTGSARLAQEARERAAALARQQEIERQQREFERRRQALEAQIAALRVDLEAGEDESATGLAEARGREEQLVQDQDRHGRSRRTDRNGGEGGSR